MKTCSIPSYGNKLFCKGYCIKHYMRHHRHGDPLFVWGTNVESNIVTNREKEKSVMEESYIVYYHIGKELSHTVVKGYSPAEVTYIVGERFKKNQGFGVDGIMTVARESEMNATRFCTL